jgi:excisionase family DNA binding protein
MDFNEFLTIKEIAKQMKVSGMTVYRMVQSGELLAIKFGKSYRIPVKELDRYLKNNYVVAVNE